jgi:integrase
MERHAYSINFWVLPTKVGKDGTIPIRAIITLNGLRTSLSTGRKVQLSDWDNVKQRVKGNNEQAKLTNTYLQEIKNKIARLELELLQRGYIITATLLKDAYFNNVESIQTKTLIQVFQDYINSQEKIVGNGISKSTFYSYTHSFRLIKEYIKKQYNRDDMFLLELNYSFIENFNIFLKTEYKQRINTTVKHLKCLKRITNIAIANKYLQFDPFLNHKLEREVVEKAFLSEEELRRIINKDFSIARLGRVRDIFIFSCFTGLSYSDVKSLNESHFINDDEGRIWIKKHRVKTGVLSRIPLLPIPKLILEKYKGGDKLLPVIDISSTDAYLKEIADLCGINKKVSFHTARFTFATTVTLTNRISLEVVSKMMGHTNTRMTSHYAKIIDNYIGEEMDKIDSKNWSEAKIE